MAVFPWITIVLSSSALALGLCANEAVFACLVYDRQAIGEGQWWRLLTGHVLHWHASHLWWDVLPFLALGSACEWIHRNRYVCMCSLAALMIGLGIYRGLPDMNFYAGLSGIVSAQFIAVALVAMQSRDIVLRCAGGSAGLLFGGKLVWEWCSGTALFVDGNPYPPVPLAHALGALAGVAFVLPLPSRLLFGQAKTE